MVATGTAPATMDLPHPSRQVLSVYYYSGYANLHVSAYLLDRHNLMARKKPPTGPRITNRKARFSFELLERFEAGIALQGTEVKSLRNGQASLEEAYARLQGTEFFLVNCHIRAYEHGNVYNHEPLRARKLLLRRREIRKLSTKVTQRGLTIVPLQIYFNERGWAKVELALARGKARRDKRQDLKKRDQQREMRSALKKR